MLSSGIVCYPVSSLRLQNSESLLSATWIAVSCNIDCWSSLNSYRKYQVWVFSWNWSGKERKARWPIDLKADGEDWEKICSHWWGGIFDGSQLWLMCVLDSAHLKQLCNIEVNFLLLSENKIAKYSTIKGFQVNTSFWRRPVCCVVNSHKCSRFLHEPYFLLVLMPYLFLPCFISFSYGCFCSSTSLYCLSSLLLEDTCLPACMCNQEVCLTIRVTVRFLDEVGTGNLAFFFPPIFAQSWEKCDPCLGQNSVCYYSGPQYNQYWVCNCSLCRWELRARHEYKCWCFLSAAEVADTKNLATSQTQRIWRPGGEVVDGVKPNSLESYSNPLTKSLFFPSQPQHSGCESLLCRRSRHLEQPVCFLHPPSAFT